jgi:hypothetical protein
MLTYGTSYYLVAIKRRQGVFQFGNNGTAAPTKGTKNYSWKTVDAEGRPAERANQGEANIYCGM